MKEYNKTYELCPHCGNEVELKAKLTIQTCPKCYKKIVSCSMCNKYNHCAKCSLSKQANIENNERSN